MLSFILRFNIYCLLWYGLALVSASENDNIFVGGYPYELDKNDFPFEMASTLSATLGRFPYDGQLHSIELIIDECFIRSPLNYDNIVGTCTPDGPTNNNYYAVIFEVSDDAEANMKWKGSLAKHAEGPSVVKALHAQRITVKTSINDLGSPQTIVLAEPMPFNKNNVLGIYFDVDVTKRNPIVCDLGLGQAVCIPLSKKYNPLNPSDRPKTGGVGFFYSHLEKLDDPLTPLPKDLVSEDYDPYGSDIALRAYGEFIYAETPVLPDLSDPRVLVEDMIPQVVAAGSGLTLHCSIGGTGEMADWPLCASVQAPNSPGSTITIHSYAEHASKHPSDVVMFDIEVLGPSPPKPAFSNVDVAVAADGVTLTVTFSLSNVPGDTQPVCSIDGSSIQPATTSSEIAAGNFDCRTGSVTISRTALGGDGNSVVLLGTTFKAGHFPSVPSSMAVVLPSSSPSATPTPSMTPSRSPSMTPSRSPTSSVSPSPSRTPSNTPTMSPTSSVSPSSTPLPSKPPRSVPLTMRDADPVDASVQAPELVVISDLHPDVTLPWTLSRELEEGEEITAKCQLSFPWEVESRAVEVSPTTLTWRKGSPLTQSLTLHSVFDGINPVSFTNLTEYVVPFELSCSLHSSSPSRRVLSEADSLRVHGVRVRVPWPHLSDVLIESREAGAASNFTSVMHRKNFRVVLNTETKLLLRGESGSMRHFQQGAAFAPGLRVWVGDVRVEVVWISTSGDEAMIVTPRYDVLCKQQGCRPSQVHSLTYANPLPTPEDMSAFLTTLARKQFNIVVDSPVYPWTRAETHAALSCPPNCPTLHPGRMDGEVLQGLPLSSKTRFAKGVRPSEKLYPLDTLTSLGIRYSLACVGSLSGDACYDVQRAGGCSLGAGDSCRSCPDGLFCIGGTYAVPQPGFWVSSITAASEGESVQECDPPRTERCPGGDLEDLTSTFECGDGYRGAACGACESFHYQDAFGACKPCSVEDADWNRAAMIIGAFLGSVVVFFLIIFCAVLIIQCRVGGTIFGGLRRATHFVLWSIAILQLIAQVGRNISEGLPTVLKSMYEGLLVLQLELPQVRPECLNGSRPFQKEEVLFCSSIFLCILLAVTTMINVRCLRVRRDNLKKGGTRGRKRGVSTVKMTENPLNQIGRKSTASVDAGEKKPAEKDGKNSGRRLSCAVFAAAMLPLLIRGLYTALNLLYPIIAYSSLQMLVCVPGDVAVRIEEAEESSSSLSPKSLSYPVVNGTVVVADDWFSGNFAPFDHQQEYFLASNPLYKCFDNFHFLAGVLGAIAFVVMVLGYPVVSAIYVKRVATSGGIYIACKAIKARRHLLRTGEAIPLLLTSKRKGGIEKKSKTPTPKSSAVKAGKDKAKAEKEKEKVLGEMGSEGQKEKGKRGSSSRGRESSAWIKKSWSERSGESSGGDSSKEKKNALPLISKQQRLAGWEEEVKRVDATPVVQRQDMVPWLSNEYRPNTYWTKHLDLLLFFVLAFMQTVVYTAGAEALSVQLCVMMVLVSAMSWFLLFARPFLIDQRWKLPVRVASLWLTVLASVAALFSTIAADAERREKPMSSGLRVLSDLIAWVVFFGCVVVVCILFFAFFLSLLHGARLEAVAQEVEKRQTENMNEVLRDLQRERRENESVTVIAPSISSVSGESRRRGRRSSMRRVSRVGKKGKEKGSRRRPSSVERRRASSAVDGERRRHSYFGGSLVTPPPTVESEALQVERDEETTTMMSNSPEEVLSPHYEANQVQEEANQVQEEANQVQEEEYKAPPHEEEVLYHESSLSGEVCDGGEAQSEVVGYFGESVDDIDDFHRNYVPPPPSYTPGSGGGSAYKEDEVVDTDQPCVWTRYVEEDSGRAYFYNPAYGKSIWEPSAGEDPHDLWTWKDFLDRDQREIYWWHSQSGDTVWDRDLPAPTKSQGGITIDSTDVNLDGMSELLVCRELRRRRLRRKRFIKRVKRRAPRDLSHLLEGKSVRSKVKYIEAKQVEAKLAEKIEFDVEERDVPL